MNIKFFLPLAILVFYTIGNMNEGRYNLRSNRGECRIPIQLQLASDAEFLMASGEDPSSSHSGQVGFTDLSDSGSDIDIDALVDHSDQNLSPTSHNSEGIHNASKGHAPQSMGSNRNDVDQNHINTQILAQLNALGARLDNMESSMKIGKKTGDSSKIKSSRVKTRGGVAHASLKGVGASSPPVHAVSNIPSPSHLREEPRIQEEVQNRLRHLADNVKPGMGKTRLGQLGANISPDRSSLTPQVLIGNFLKHNYPLLYELQHINLLCLYLPKEDGVSPDAEYITQIIFSIFLQ